MRQRGNGDRQGHVRGHAAGAAADQIELGSVLSRRRTRASRPKRKWSAATAPIEQRVRLREGRPGQPHVPGARRAGRRSIRRAATTRRTCMGIQVGQPLQIVNSDDTLHNVHGLAKANKEFNQGQPIQGMKMTHTFSTKEVMIPFKCDVHGWMNAWIGVLDHPYLRRDDRGRDVLAEGAAARHLHDRGVAREARHADADGHGRREGNQGRRVHVQSVGGSFRSRCSRSSPRWLRLPPLF